MTHLNPDDCPIGVFGYQRLGIAGCLLQMWKGRGVANVAERDANIAKQAAAF